MSIDIDSICKGFCIMLNNEPINIYIYIYIYIYLFTMEHYAETLTNRVNVNTRTIN